MGGTGDVFIVEFCSRGKRKRFSEKFLFAEKLFETALPQLVSLPPLPVFLLFSPPIVTFYSPPNAHIYLYCCSRHGCSI